MIQLNKGIGVHQIMRLFSVLSPIMEQVSKTTKPIAVHSKIIEDEFEGKKRYIVVQKAAYEKKEDAEQFLKLDELVDKI